MISENSENSDNQFYCKKCNYKCSLKQHYIQHCKTIKHNDNKKISNDTQNSVKNAKAYICVCGSKYLHASGLSRHKKVCNYKEEPNKNQIEEIESIISSVIKKELTNIVEDKNISILENNKQNQDFQKQNLELQKDMFTQIIELMKTSLTTNNINNCQITNNNNYNQFNLQVYLNETCKNAMTINQFLDYLEPTVEELEATAYLGYVEGISRIIMRGFKNLEEEELPFHCTDLKREHIYVKNPDEEWVEEKDEKPLLLRFIKEVARKNFNNVAEWQKKNPNWASYHSKQNDMFMKILNNSMSGGTEEEQQANYEKIMKNIMKNTVIDRSKKNKSK